MKDKSYTPKELLKLYKEYDKEGWAKCSTYKGLHEGGHFTIYNFLNWLKEKEEK